MAPRRGRVGRAGAVAAVLLMAPLFTTAAEAGEAVRARGEVALETRVFVPDDDPATQDANVGLAARLEATHRHRPFRETLRIFGRADAFEQGRAAFYVEEGWVEFRKRWFRLRVGPQMVNWTATEAFHPADVLNSRNLDSNVENADKIGEPMVWAQFRFWQGALSLYYMPFRMRPRLPGGSSRLSLAPRNARVGEALWLDRGGTIGAGVIEHQWAATLGQSFGGADLALQVVQHNDRSQPTVLINPATFDARPLFGLVTHVGLTYAHVLDAFVLKAEGAWRMFADVDDLQGRVPAALLTGARGDPRELARTPDHGQAAVGLEYGWTYGDGGDGTLLLEGQAVLGPSKAQRRALSPFQADVLVGYRHAFNDVHSKELTLGLIVDVERWPEVLGSVRYQQRLSDTWSARASLRVTHAPGGGDRPSGLQALHKSHHATFDLIRHF